jgi:hypothetical protein
MNYTMQELRENVAARIHVADATIIPDIMNKSHDQLIRLLDRLTAPYDKGGLNYKILITSLDSDHSPDNTPDKGGLNNHGHTNNWSVDLWPYDESQLKAMLIDLASKDMFVTKIGLGGKAQQYYDLLQQYGNVVVFMDNSSDHIHLQSAEWK